MKVKEIKTVERFEPIVIELTIESKEELIRLYNEFAYSNASHSNIKPLYLILLKILKDRGLTSLA